MGDAILSTFHRLPYARWMVTTLGSRGSVLLERSADESADDSALEAVALDDLIQRTFAELGGRNEAASTAGLQPACRSSSGVEIWEGAVAAPERSYRLQLRHGGALGTGSKDAAARRAEAAQVAAAANADAGNAGGYSSSGEAAGQGEAAIVAKVIVAQAAKLPEVSLVLLCTGVAAFLNIKWVY